MKYWLVVFSFIVIDFQAKSDTMKWLNYHQEIIKAENLLMAEEKEEALELYADIIQGSTPPFLYDFLLPLQVAVEVKDSVSFELFVNGLRLSESTKKDLNRAFEKNVPTWDEDWGRRLLNSKDVKVEKTYQLFIDSLFKCDQQERNKVYETSFLRRKKAEKKWDQHSFERIEAFVEIVEKSGFPTEGQMGIDGKFFYHRDLMAIFYHYPRSYSCFESFFDRWLNSGKLHPRHYAWIVDFERRHLNRKAQKKSIYFYGVFAQMDPKFSVEKMNKAELVMMNKSRLDIGLPRVEHDLKLTAFVKKKQYYKPTFL